MIRKHLIIIRLFDVFSKKDKRQIIQSMIRKISHRYHISIAETGHLENLQLAEITFALVANDKKFLERVETKILQVISEDYNVDVIKHYAEWDFMDFRI